MGPRTPSQQSGSAQDEADAFAASLNKDAIRSIALDARRQSGSPSLSCTIGDTPAFGSENVVFALEFSDGVRWAMRIPLSSELTTSSAEAIRLNVLAQQYIQTRTSVPVPAIHGYSCTPTPDCALGHPYILMDCAPGVLLEPFWDDATWWATRTFTKETVLESLAKHMVALSALTFDRIGRLDRDAGGGYFVAAHPSLGYLFEPPVIPEGGFGPFETAHAYLHAMLDAYWKEDDPRFGLVRMLIGALYDPRFDGPPFMFVPPDFNTQNVMFDPHSGEVTALIDWDGVSIEPRPMGALAYPTWLVQDWNPTMGQADPAEMHRLRLFYADAVTRLGGPRCGEVTRNSHVFLTLANAVGGELCRTASMFELGKFVFGDLDSTFDVLASIGRSAWLKADPGELLQLPDAESETGDEGTDEQHAQPIPIVSELAMLKSVEPAAG